MNTNTEVYHPDAETRARDDREMVRLQATTQRYDTRRAATRSAARQAAVLVELLLPLLIAIADEEP